VSRHQAHHARIQSLRAEAEALEEQLKTSVSALATLRHELFDTPATTFPADSRPVPFDELLQYAKNISKHTVPPTFRERAPQAADKDDGASSVAPTNGLNTPVAPVAPDTEEPKEGDKADAAPADITAEEEEWLKKLNESKIAWYPWPSNDKIRVGNLSKIMYWQAKGKNIDDFDIHAYEEAERRDLLKIEQDKASEDTAQAEEPQPQPQPQQQQPAVPRPAPKPAQPRETFDAFDDLDD
jgi:hypothetical protein